MGHSAVWPRVTKTARLGAEQDPGLPEPPLAGGDHPSAERGGPLVPAQHNLLLIN